MGSMLGFLIHDERLFSTRVAIGACRALRTYEYQNTESVGRLRMHFFRNASANNYFLTDKRYTLGVAGTLIFNNVHGSEAMGNLLKTLHSGRQLADLFDQFRGPYTLILADRLTQQVSLLNSREGLRNCFFTIQNDLRAHSTNLLLLAALTGGTPCADGVREFIHIGATLEGKTIFENIERLSPAALHRYRNERWTTSRLWRLAVSVPDAGISRQNATRTMTELFVRNFEFTKNVNSGRCAADLTGGTDTRTVLCCLMQQHPMPVASTSGAEDFIDVRIARRIARKLGIEHYWYHSAAVQTTHERIARAVELADGSMCPIMLARQLPYYEEKARRFDFITGGGGGPLFKDHYWLFEFNRVGLQREPHWDRIAKFSLVGHAIRDDFFVGFNDRILNNLARLFRRHSSEVTGTNNQKLDFVYFDLKTPAFGGQAFSLTTQFLDVFHPMLDGENVGYSINLPPEIRVLNKLQFGMIRSLRPELSWITTDTGLPTIPPVGAYSWLRVLRARRYIETGIRKARTSLFGSGRQRTNKSIDVDELRRLEYFDLLAHSSLAFSFLVSPAKLAAFIDTPTQQPNQSYVIGTLALQLFFQRVKELVGEARNSSKADSTEVSLGSISN
jgi:asparagine synthetase B (glutamine-hydrolysing)